MPSNACIVQIYSETPWKKEKIYGRRVECRDRIIHSVCFFFRIPRSAGTPFSAGRRCGAGCRVLTLPCPIPRNRHTHLAGLAVRFVLGPEAPRPAKRQTHSDEWLDHGLRVLLHQAVHIRLHVELGVHRVADHCRQYVSIHGSISPAQCPVRDPVMTASCHNGVRLHPGWCKLTSVSLRLPRLGPGVLHLGLLY